MTNRCLTPGQKLEFKRLHGDGEKMEYLAVLLGVSRRTLNYLIHELGLTPRPKTRKPTKTPGTRTLYHREYYHRRKRSRAAPAILDGL